MAPASSSIESTCLCAGAAFGRIQLCRQLGQRRLERLQLLRSLALHQLTQLGCHLLLPRALRGEQGAEG